MPTDKSLNSTNGSRTLTAKGRLGVTEWFYLLGLVLLSIGIFLQYSLPLALIVLGGMLVGVSVVTSFFETWLTVRMMKGDK